MDVMDAETVLLHVRDAPNREDQAASRDIFLMGC